MLRKRAIFKPNLSQVPGPKASEQQPVKEPEPPKSNPNTENDPVGQAAAAAQESPGPPLEAPSTETPTETPTSTPTAQPAPSISTEEAIKQLTGQKFEPIKSINLRNSANKNMKLQDLLFYNPPLTKDQKRHKKNLSIAKKKQPEKQDHDSDETEIDEPDLRPKVKMGPNGQLVIDQDSVVIRRPNRIKAQKAVVEDNEDIICPTNYGSYRKKKVSSSQTKWSTDDTEKFYQALTIFGADFSTMEALFYSDIRTRTELRKKFKREEKNNKAKIDIALSTRICLTSEELEELRDLIRGT